MIFLFKNLFRKVSKNFFVMSSAAPDLAFKLVFKYTKNDFATFSSSLNASLEYTKDLLTHGVD